MPTLRLLTYNIRSLRDDRDAVVRVIRDARPHVVCLQESPRFLRWRSTCAALARRSGLVIVGGGRPAGSNLLMSTLSVEVRRTEDVRLSKEPRLEQRGAEFAELSYAGRPFVLAGTHLDLEQPARLRHADELIQSLAEFAGELPAVLAGDINDEPDSDVWARLAGPRADVFAVVGDGPGHTYSAKNAVRRIDGVFADQRLAPVSATVIDSPDVRVASDHRPVLVELEL